MHDGLSLTRTDAILRHGRQAFPVKLAFQLLPPAHRNRILIFLDSL